MSRRRVLFLCTHNSARSQMAEGFLRAWAGDRFEVASAGTEATRVHPLAIRAMAEAGIDLGAHTSKSLDRFVAEPWDVVITVCDGANERLAVFRRVRDEIAGRLRAWLAGREAPSGHRSTAAR